MITGRHTQYYCKPALSCCPLQEFLAWIQSCKGVPSTGCLTRLPALYVDTWTLLQRQHLTLILSAEDLQTPSRKLQPDFDLNSCTSRASTQSYSVQVIGQHVSAAQSPFDGGAHLPLRHHQQVLDSSSSEDDDVRLCKCTVHPLFPFLNNVSQRNQQPLYSQCMSPCVCCFLRNFANCAIK